MQQEKLKSSRADQQLLHSLAGISEFSFLCMNGAIFGSGLSHVNLDKFVSLSCKYKEFANILVTILHDFSSKA